VAKLRHLWLRFLVPNESRAYHAQRQQNGHYQHQNFHRDGENRLLLLIHY
jgi:hypothetical protein